MSPRLFTAGDVERAARLAAVAAIKADREHWDVEKTHGPIHSLTVENAVHEATFVIADDSPPFYSEEEVKLMLQYLLTKEDVDAEFEEALNIIRK